MTYSDLMKEWKRLHNKSLQALENARTAELLGDRETADNEYLTYELCLENMSVIDEKMTELE